MYLFLLSRLKLMFALCAALSLCLISLASIKGAAYAAGTASSPSQNTNWSQFEFNVQHAGYNPYETILNPSNVSGLKLNWQYTNRGNVYSSAAVVNGVIYFGSINDKFYALNAATGAFKWRYATSGAINSSPAVINGMVYFGSGNGTLYALNASNGKFKWSYTTGGAIDSSPAVVNGIVYFGSADDKLYALNANTGTLEWSYTTGGIINSSPAVNAGIVYIGSNDASLYALDATSGTLIWSYSIKNGYNIINSSPAVANGDVYIGSYDIQGVDTNLYALNATTGTLQWTYSVNGCGIDSAPTVAGGVVYVGSDGSGGYEDGCFAGANLFALNAMTGTPVWDTYIGGPDSSNNSSPIIADGVLYVGSNDFDHTNSGGYAMWYALDLSSGDVLWHRLDNAPHHGPTTYPNPAPVVVNGVLYISSGAYNGWMHSFHLAS